MVEKEKTKKKTAVKPLHPNVVKAHDKKMPAVVKVARAKKAKAPAKTAPVAEAMVEPVLTVAAEMAETKGAPRYFYAIGRRKRSRAIVRLFTRGTGEITVNGHDWKKYFPTAQLIQVIEAPLIEAGQRNNVNAQITVEGGGKQGQAGAVSLGLARALLKLNPVFRRALRRHGFLTRDSREKERKKYGLKKARRAPQFAKR